MMNLKDVIDDGKISERIYIANFWYGSLEICEPLCRYEVAWESCPFLASCIHPFLLSEQSLRIVYFQFHVLLQVCHKLFVTG